METFRALIRGDLPPVGGPIAYFSGDSQVPLPVFGGYSSYWIDSGTSALALAFLSIKSLRAEMVFPEVILPGYCCPDLVAAAHYAGLRPVIIDIEIDDPALDQHALRAAITANTVAIIAINFLGVGENFQALQALKIEHPHLLIVEDNAQWFPCAEELHLLSGDFVTFSFGRGKPVSLLGGGLLLSKCELSSEVVANVKRQQNLSGISSLLLMIKYFIYNRLTEPFFYQFLNRNPLLSLGQTRYHSLLEITSMDSVRSTLLATNMELYANSNAAVDLKYDQLFLDIGFQNAFKPLGTNRRRRLLRYPVLFSSIEQKNRIYPKLVKLGLGATEMYKMTLPEIEGVKDISTKGSLKNAISFASRFISLPVHGAVTAEHLQLIQDIFSDK